VGENIDLYCTASILAPGPTQLGAGRGGCMWVDFLWAKAAGA